MWLCGYPLSFSFPSQAVKCVRSNRKFNINALNISVCSKIGFFLIINRDDSKCGHKYEVTYILNLIP